MKTMSWINEYTGEVDDKNINMQEMEELHAEVKQLYTVRKQIKLTESTDQVKVRLLCLIEGKYINSPVYRLIVPRLTGIKLCSCCMHQTIGVSNELQRR